MKTTQCQKILKALRAGRCLTMLDGFKLCGTMNLHKRIAEIERRGFGVIRVWRGVGKRRLRAWRLARKNEF